MPSLIKYAQLLAQKPPVNTYKRTMQLASQEQLASIEEQVNLGNMKEGDDIYNESRKNALRAASKYEDMLKDNGQDVATFSITSICDFTAMCAMMIAAGSKRIEALKAAVRGKKATTVVETEAGDHAYVFSKPDKPNADDPGAFQKILNGWCQAKDNGNGIVQFKFPAGGDFHTFAVERISTNKKETRFVVYQAYQNTYSLAHFLGLRSVWEDDALTLHHKQVYKEESKKGEFAVKYKSEQDYFDKGVKQQFNNIDTVVAHIGRGQELDANALNERVITPLMTMLRGQLQKNVYVSLTGSSTSSGRIGTPSMFVLMCHQVSPDQYEENCRALYEVPNDLTIYVS
jgi:hypothetical protein